ncbi:transmembrane amino acid transporter protein-domain-containing protein [Fimicolochytrium jonesii]|uniref:transmembrane amino acid transporter protein-domain-containing protein n=1 Tax=Fimicolochytrium jonesii TaxID=1396493 RepID=UPI0022FDBDE3|nr:transmembrane amino acid transporter protein-domain-containing protein [Fimicolochytrium jonesii]KAI8827222.1 transmembrane amino acid transporter protein-domain-containing protein [Fimicolochytrium jonesii]
MHTVLNSVNLLSGVGMLSLPYAMSLCGWVVGISLLLFFPILASTTAKLLIQCMEVRTTTLPGPAGGAASYTPKKSMSYGDAAETAFGPRARRFIDVVYQLELMAACVAFVILASDSVHALYPDIPLLAVKVAVAAVVLLTTFIKSVKVLSYGSAIGILCTINLLIIILFDGTSTYETPGSLWNPAQTEMWPRSWNRVALAIGMMFVGFDGHAVFPAIYRDMRTPESFAKCINLTYVVVTVLYLTVAVAGYLMFGNSILPEITQNLPLIPGYNPASTNWTIYLIALNPIAKYALCLRPVHTSLEIRLASKKHASTIDEEEVIPPSPPPPYSESVTPAVSSPPTPPFLPRTQPPYRPPQPPVSPHTSTTASYFHAILIRSSLTLIILAIAILFPHFHDVMATLGSLFSGFVAVMFPCAAFGKLYWRDRELHRGIRVTVVAGLTVGVIIIVGGLSGVVWGPG